MSTQALVAIGRDIGSFFPAIKLENSLGLQLLAASAVGWLVYQMPRPGEVDERAVFFLAALAVASTFWLLESFDEYVVAMGLLLSLAAIVPSKMALSGFSSESWLFVLAAFGLAAGLSQSGLLNRLALKMLKWIPTDKHKILSLVLSGSGISSTFFLLNSQPRVVIMSPICAAIMKIARYNPKSNGAARLGFSVLIGHGSLSFMSLTGATFCLLGWAALPEVTKARFDWGMWALAALPAGLVTLAIMLFAIHYLFPAEKNFEIEQSMNEVVENTEKPLTKAEWIGLGALALALSGWLTKPYHGLNEAWVALAALQVFLVSGILDKKGFTKESIDWGFMIYLAVMQSVASIFANLAVDRWLMRLIHPYITFVSFHPLAFLLSVLLLVYLLRFFLPRLPVVMMLTLGLSPWAMEIGVNPGIVLLTILMAIDPWFTPQQSSYYAFMLRANEGKFFSHSQGRKMMIARLIASIFAVIASVPFWRLMGFIN